MKLDDLLRDNYMHNPNQYIGDGLLYCLICKKRTQHAAYFKRRTNTIDDKRVCTVCLIVYGHEAK